MNNTIQNSTITDDLKYVMTLDKLTEYLSCLICLPGKIDFFRTILFTNKSWFKIFC